MHASPASSTLREDIAYWSWCFCAGCDLHILLKPTLQAAAFNWSALIGIQFNLKPIGYPWSSLKSILLLLVGLFPWRSPSAISPQPSLVDHFFVFFVSLQKVLTSKCNLLLEKKNKAVLILQPKTNISKKYDLVLLQRNKRNIKGENKSIHLHEIPVKCIRNEPRACGGSRLACQIHFEVLCPVSVTGGIYSRFFFLKALYRRFLIDLWPRTLCRTWQQEWLKARKTDLWWRIKNGIWSETWPNKDAQRTSPPPAIAWRCVSSGGRDKLCHSPTRGLKGESCFFFFLNEEQPRQIDSLGLWAVPESCKVKVAAGPRSTAEHMSSTFRKCDRSLRLPTAPIVPSPRAHLLVTYDLGKLCSLFAFGNKLSICNTQCKENESDSLVGRGLPVRKIVILVIDTQRGMYVTRCSRFSVSKSSQVYRKCIIIKSTK